MSDTRLKCQWCGGFRPATPGTCPHCHRFPNTRLENNMESLEEMIRNLVRHHSLKGENRTRHRLPEPLDGDTHFTWGPVVELHKLPRFNAVIVEYKPQIFDDGGGATGKYSDEHSYHLNGTSSSFESLESAIIFAIAKHNKVDDSFAIAACHLLKAE